MKRADKDGTGVVLNPADYVAECTRLLSNTTFCPKLDSDPTNKHGKLISDKLERGVSSGEIDSGTAKSLIVYSLYSAGLIFSPRSVKEGIQEDLNQ
ncbi:hypothetical protein PoB_000662900 [Plakobranchus ocellatus]|uniref:EF-hand domain-containing protein n=1 Tax=Plakobranchus ocellatus TaxID=259542 RepID=A0AAV3YDH4_9GAST|nr:hypothetical protein PoB_000662900 [Plakobranchus ocellatus]